MIFAAYLDESGTHAGSPSVSVAGYLSTPERWQRFDDGWRAALVEFGIDHFHMTDFAASAQQFSGWSKEKHEACFARLLAIINRNVIGWVGASIPVSEYRSSFSDAAHKFVGGPYGLAATVCFFDLADVLNGTGAFGSIAYTFETGAVGAGRVLEVAHHIDHDPGLKDQMRLHSVKFENKRSFTPLQAADILVYELNKQSTKDWGIDQRAPREFSLSALSAVPYEAGYLASEQLAMWSRVLSVRAGLKDSELAPPTAAHPPTGPQILISIEDLQARWRWWHRFMGRGLRRRVPAA